MEVKISPFSMVIFGATGDLTARKLMPALYHLLLHKKIPGKFLVIGVARRGFSDQEFRNLMREAVKKHARGNGFDEDIWKILSGNLFYQQGYFEEDKPYRDLINRLKKFDEDMGACITRFFYLATPPQNYPEILNHLSKSKLSEGCGSPFLKASGDKQDLRKWTRILIEKPFGKDLATSKVLEEILMRTFEEKQIYRIDHYLAKETVQNILAFRFANQFEALWSRDYIDHVQISLLESHGVGTRGSFYEGTGALKDVLQNHLMAILAYIAMEEPASFEVSDIRKKRAEVLEKIRCEDEKTVNSNVVRGQYGQGIISGKEARGYRQESGVDPKSITETYVAAKLFIDNDCWKGVPFFLRTGKRLRENLVKIDVVLKSRKSALFPKIHADAKDLKNVISIRIQPKEGIALHFFAKQPGFLFELQPVDMDFSYTRSFNREIMDSYEKILVDSMAGDQTLFATGRGFEATWNYVSSIENAWKKGPGPVFPNYRAGSWGPEEADRLIKRDGREWIDI